MACKKLEEFAGRVRLEDRGDDSGGSRGSGRRQGVSRRFSRGSPSEATIIRGLLDGRRGRIRLPAAARTSIPASTRLDAVPTPSTLCPGAEMPTRFSDITSIGYAQLLADFGVVRPVRRGCECRAARDSTLPRSR